MSPRSSPRTGRRIAHGQRIALVILRPQATDHTGESRKSNAWGTGFSFFFSLFFFSLVFFSRFFFLPQSIANGQFRRYLPVVGGPYTGQLAD
ncbi:hypothetical protein GW17_00039650 [Ensete ventricosum]|nr:hypothetical protein GW17_00039650 [Ensete ventricosum]